MNTTTLAISEEALDLLKHKDDLLFQILLLMSQDRKGNYCIEREYTAVIEEALRLYIHSTYPSNHEHSGRFEERIQC